MKAIAKHIRTTLLANAAITALVGTKIYWELGKDVENLPLIQYNLQEIPATTKDNRSFTATVRCYGDNMDDVGELYELVKTSLEAARGTFRNGQSGLSDDEAKEAVAEVVIDFKI